MPFVTKTLYYDSLTCSLYWFKQDFQVAKVPLWDEGNFIILYSLRFFLFVSLPYLSLWMILFSFVIRWTSLQKLKLHFISIKRSNTLLPNLHMRPSLKP
ncbi:hypothetical protein CR513_27343, partial [Mucuna pruriens]